MLKPLLKSSLVLLLCLAGAAASAQPRVMATIKPLQFIAAAITDGVIEPAVLMSPGGDPHHYSLRPSERRALGEAEVLLWVGGPLEGFLRDLVGELPGRSLAALDLDGAHVLRPGGEADPHLWLDPRNAGVLAAALAEALAAADPAKASVYESNLAAFRKRLDAVDAEVREALEAVPAPRAYAVYHNAFRYFEAHYGLAHAASFVENEELNPGIRQLLAVRERLRGRDVGCILVEPQVNTARLRNVIENEAMRYVSVDVLGREIAVAPDAYPRLLRNMADAFLTCIQ